MKILSKPLLKLAIITVFVGLSIYAFVSYMAHAERRNNDIKAVESCKQIYEKKLSGFNTTFENVTPQHINDYDMEVTGTVIYLDKDGSTKKEQLECKTSIE
jgi:hypothetical protein